MHIDTYGHQNQLFVVAEFKAADVNKRAAWSNRVLLAVVLFC